VIAVMEDILGNILFRFFRQNWISFKSFSGEHFVVAAIALVRCFLFTLDRSQKENDQFDIFMLHINFNSSYKS
jgi:hypothetical protein